MKISVPAAAARSRSRRPGGGGLPPPSSSSSFAAPPPPPFSHAAAAAAAAAASAAAAGPTTAALRARRQKGRFAAAAVFWAAFVVGHTFTTELYYYDDYDSADDRHRSHPAIGGGDGVGVGAAAAGTENDPHSNSNSNNKLSMMMTPSHVLRHKQQQQQQQQEGTPSSAATVCEALSQQLQQQSSPPSPLQLWVDWLPQILAASQLANLDPNYKLEAVTARVLDLITPRLSRSVKVLPRDNDDDDYDSNNNGKSSGTIVGRLLSKLERRWNYLQQQQQNDRKNNDDPPPPPLVVTVLGGSVTAGVNCQTGIPRLHLERCAWPARLQQLLDRLFGVPGHVVRVQTLAVGGTNTATGVAILEYDLLELPLAQTDILINAYATNDMHALTVNEAQQAGLSLRDKVFNMAQDFVRAAYSANSSHNDNKRDGGGCKKNQQQERDDDESPLLLYWLDDYLGNEQRAILATQELAQSVDVLAQYYGFGFVSYADAVRDRVYGDTRETMFSPSGWYQDDNSTTMMQREVHPGQAMHLSVAYMMLYNFLTAASEHCARQSHHRRKRQQHGGGGSGEESPLQAARRQPVVEDGSIRRFSPRAPGPRPAGLPPPLHANLTLDAVSAEWQRSASNSEQNAHKNCTFPDAVNDGNRNKRARRRCPFSWVSAMPWRERDEIEALFLPLLTTRDHRPQQQQQWHVHDTTKRQNKLGWMPRTGTLGEQLAFYFTRQEHAADQLESVTFFFLKSYGAMWANSTVSVAVERQLENTDQWESALEEEEEDVDAPYSLTGFHDKRTSETYTETVRLRQPLDPQQATKAIRVTLTLVGGSTFKLMGIAACQ